MKNNDKKKKEKKKKLKNSRSRESSPILAREEAGAMEGGPRHEIIGGTGRESRETTVFHAFERRAAERTSGQKAIRGRQERTRGRRRRSTVA